MSLKLDRGFSFVSNRAATRTQPLGLSKVSNKMSRANLFMFSIIGGAFITIMLTWTAFSIDNKKLSHVLLWQDTILVSLVGRGPLLGHDAQGNARYEGTPMHQLILPFGFLLSIPIYSTVSYLVLRGSFGLRPDPKQDAG